MIILNFDLTTGLAKLAQATTIKFGADVPVQVILSASGSAPSIGTITGVELALGDDSAAPTVLAFTDVFTPDNDTTWSGVLSANTTQLATALNGKAVVTVNAELTVINDGERMVAPNIAMAVQQRIVAGPVSVESGPEYYTTTEVDTLLTEKAALTVAGKYRIKGDGTLQLWNATQSKWHALTITGAAGAEVLQIGAGES